MIFGFLYKFFASFFENNFQYKYADSVKFEVDLNTNLDDLNRNSDLFANLKKGNVKNILEAYDNSELKYRMQNVTSEQILDKVKDFFFKTLLNIAENYLKLRKYNFCIKYCNDLLDIKNLDKARIFKCFSLLKSGSLVEGLQLEKLYDLRSLDNTILKMVAKIEDVAFAKKFIISDVSNNKTFQATGINNEFLLKIITFFKKIKVETKELLLVLKLSYDLLSNLDNINFVDTEKDVMVFGDTHGQFFDTFGVLLTIKGIGFDLINGFEFDKNTYFVFNGDFVDRGKYSIENYTFLLILKILYPNNIFLNRGNHEFENQSIKGGFYQQIEMLYGSESVETKKAYDVYKLTFSVLPLATVINRKIFVVHGGLPTIIPSVDDILILDRKSYDITSRHKNIFFKEPSLNKNLALVIGLMWSDPTDDLKNWFSSRGFGIEYGKNSIMEFFEKNGFLLFVRSHDYAENGFKLHQNGNVITVFSAPNYCGKRQNKAAYIVFNSTKTGTEVCENLYYDVIHFDEWPNTNVDKLAVF